ncbi:hypothetical protein ACOME3_004510 [Neoechinorhynchus agilis]
MEPIEDCSSSVMEAHNTNGNDNLNNDNIQNQEQSPNNAPTPIVHRTNLSENCCGICKDKSSGRHYGIRACEACRAFYKRYLRNNRAYVCYKENECVINSETRRDCKGCRLTLWRNARLHLGNRQIPNANANGNANNNQDSIPNNVIQERSANEVRDSNGKLCEICKDVAAGRHYGVNACEACRAFYKRHFKKPITHECVSNSTCTINKSTRNDCKSCRWKMWQDAISKLEL